MVERIGRYSVDPYVALGSPGPLWERLVSKGISVTTFAQSDRLGNVRRSSLQLDPRLLADVAWGTVTLRRVIRDCRAQLVVTNSQKAHVLGALAAWSCGRPVVWWLHDIVRTTSFGHWQVSVLRWLSRLVRPWFVAVSHSVENAAKSSFNTELTSCVHNGFDPQRLSYRGKAGLRERFRWPVDSLLVGLLGRLVPWKGGEAFIRAAAIVRKEVPNVRFLLVGSDILTTDPGFEGELVRLSRDLRLEEHLAFLPFQDDVGAVLRELDLLIQPSLEPEPFGNSVLEALACGLPVVAFDHGGVGEILVDGRNGRLVPPGDVRSLARAMSQLLRNSELRGLMAREAE